MNKTNTSQACMAALSETVGTSLQTTPSPSFNVYRLYLATLLVLGITMMVRGTQMETGITLLVTLSGLCVVVWFYAIVHALKGLATPQNVLLLPNFRAPLLKALMQSWIVATSVLTLAIASPVFSIAACICYCVMMEVKSVRCRSVPNTGLVVIAASAIFFGVKFFLLRQHDIANAVLMSVTMWIMIGIFAIALGLACTYRLMGLIGFCLFMVMYIFSIVFATSYSQASRNALPVALTLVVAVAFMLFYALRQSLANPSIKRVTKDRNKQKRAAVKTLTQLEDPFLQLGALLPTYNFAFNRVMAKPFNFSALLGLAVGREAHWHTFAKTSAFVSIIMVFVYGALAFATQEPIDPNLKVVFYGCAVLSILGDSWLIMRPTLRNFEILALSPLWPQADAVNNAYLRLSLLQTAVTALPTLVALGVAWRVSSATTETIGLSIMVWVALFVSRFSSRLQNFRTVEFASIVHTLNNPLVICCAIGLCFSYFPDFLTTTALFLCVASCVIAAHKLRWFRKQSAVLPPRRELYFNGLQPPAQVKEPS
jgi:hypothetical protein